VASQLCHEAAPLVPLTDTTWTQLQETAAAIDSETIQVVVSGGTFGGGDVAAAYSTEAIPTVFSGLTAMGG
jgi:hypothetical protein